MSIRVQLNAEIASINTMLQHLATVAQHHPRSIKSAHHPLHQRLQVSLTNLRLQLEALRNSPAQDLEAHPEKLTALIQAHSKLIPALVGDDQKPLTLGAYFGSDGKIYSTETIYLHLCSAEQRDRSPLAPHDDPKPWTITKHHAITELLRFYKRHKLPLNPTPNTDFFTELDIQVHEEDLSGLLPAALHQTLKTGILQLQRDATDATHKSQDVLSQSLLEWTTLFFNTLSVVRDGQGALNDPKEVIKILKLRQGSISGKLDEWFILEYFHDLLLDYLLIDPITQFPLDETACIINDQKRRTLNQTTIARLLTTYPDLEQEPHPALPAFFAWARLHDRHLKPMRIYRRHLAAKARAQQTEAYKNAQRQTLVDALRTPVQHAMASARETLETKLNAIQQEINETDEKVQQLANHTQQTDKSIQQLQADMAECNRLWQTLLNDLLPRQDAEIQKGILDLQRIQQQAQAIQDKAKGIQQSLAHRIEVLKAEDVRLKDAVAELGNHVDEVARDQLVTAQRIVELERAIAESKSGFFGELIIGLGFILGAVAGFGVTAVMAQAQIAAHTASLAGLATCATVTMLAGKSQNKNAGEYGQQHRGHRLESQPATFLMTTQTSSTSIGLFAGSMTLSTSPDTADKPRHVETLGIR